MYFDCTSFGLSQSEFFVSLRYNITLIVEESIDFSTKFII